LVELKAAAPVNSRTFEFPLKLEDLMERQFIDRIINSELEPTEMHEYLTAAMAVQDARRDGILTDWPHVLELERQQHRPRDPSPL
jgi:hypothetical protein